MQTINQKTRMRVGEGRISVAISVFFCISILNISCSTQNKIIPFTVSTSQDQVIFKVEVNGNVFYDSQKVGTLYDNGVFTNLEKDTIAFLKTDDFVYDKNQRPIAKILKDGTIDMGGIKKLSWSKDGKLQVSESDFITIKPNSEKQYWQASLLFLIYSFMDGNIQNLEFNADSENSTKISNTQIMTDIDISNITQITTGYTDSGSLGGSLPNKIRPDIHYYSKYDVKNEKLAKNVKNFHQLLENFLNNTMVNKSITLRTYLMLLENKNQEKLDQIEATSSPRPTGSSIQQHPILLYEDNAIVAKYTIDVNRIDLSGKGMMDMFHFLNEKGKQYSSEILNQKNYVNTDSIANLPKKLSATEIENIKLRCKELMLDQFTITISQTLSIKYINNTTHVIELMANSEGDGLNEYDMETLNRLVNYGYEEHFFDEIRITYLEKAEAIRDKPKVKGMPITILYLGDYGTWEEL